MKSTAILALFAAFALPAFADTVQVTYNTIYDDPSNSLSITACSNGANGLLTKGYTTFDSLPNFPYIGGIPGLTWNSTECGSCWELTYTEASGATNTINVLAVDGAWTFNLSLEAMNALTGGIAVEKGTVTATAAKVDPSVCGM
ncbi:Cerato-platanin [Phlebopus sp. FC_14]|nr:Cerato-platanin [Phlebopus sp. FC_14]